MKQKQITNKEAREELLAGINIVGDIVGSTLGPYGRNVCIDGMITNDGVSIAQSIFLEDAAKNVGAYLIKEAAKKTNTMVGDGTTTTTVLTQKLSQEFNKLILIGESGIFIRNEANKFLKTLTDILKTTSIKCETLDKLSDIATISVENRNIGELIAKTTLEVGKDGLVTSTESKTGETYTEIFKGMKIERGYVSPYMCNNLEKMTVEEINIPVLVTDSSIKNFSSLTPILRELISKGIKKLLVVCDDMSANVITNILKNKNEKMFEVIAVRGPIGTQRKVGAADIATMVGAKLFTEDVDADISNATYDSLGFVEKVVAKRNETILINGRGKKKDIDNRVKSLKVEYEESESDYDKEKIKERIARLSSGVGVIYVGGQTEAEQTYLKLKIEDAINATRHAFLTGVSAGGGYGLLKLAQSVSGLASGNSVYNSIIKSLEYPLEKILINADFSNESIMQIISAARKGTYLNIKSRKEYVNPLKEGIIDPTAVLIQAITNAISTASILVTTDSLIVNIPEDKDKENYEG